MATQPSTTEEIRALGLDVCAAQRYAREDQLEEWVQKYLTTGTWANPGLAMGLKLQKRWWNGPIEVPLADLTRVVGPEPGMEYRLDVNTWNDRVGRIAESLTVAASIPPLIVEYRGGELSLRDGNTRYAAMSLRGWKKCWVVIWYNTEIDYRQHREILNGQEYLL